MTKRKPANPKRTLTPRELFDRDPTAWWTGHFADILELMKGETLRGTAVLARGYMETVLDEFLLWHALRDPENRKDLAKAVAFGLDQKIRVCKDLGLVNEIARGYMNLIRLIGDRFAHHPELREFDDDDILLEHVRKLHDMMQFAPPQKDSSRLTISMLVGALRTAVGHMGDWEYRHLHYVPPSSPL